MSASVIAMKLRTEVQPRRISTIDIALSDYQRVAQLARVLRPPNTHAPP
jgi:hypothetical protein